MLPCNLKIKNFYSHTDSEIDFSRFDSALLIGNTEGDYDKSNGSGKSSVFESILWCLFNKSRASMMDDIITWGENKCTVELVFMHKDTKYKVHRTRKRASSTSSVEFLKVHLVILFVFICRIFEHEYDHLEGVDFTQRAIY